MTNKIDITLSIIISTVIQSISISKMPNDELQGEEENIRKMFHELRKLENGSGALELGSRDSSPSRTTLRLATNNLKHTPDSLLLLSERRETYPTAMLLPMGD